MHTIAAPFPLNISTGIGYGSLRSPMLIQWESNFDTPFEINCIEFRRDCFTRLLGIAGTP